MLEWFRNQLLNAKNNNPIMYTHAEISINDYFKLLVELRNFYKEDIQEINQILGINLIINEEHADGTIDFYRLNKISKTYADRIEVLQ